MEFEQKKGQVASLAGECFSHPIPDNFKLIYNQTTIQSAVKQIASEIEQWSKGEKPLVVLALMRGALFFAADLLRYLREPLELVTVSTKTYADDGVKQSEGSSLVVNTDLKGRKVLVVDDICDSGETLTKVVAAVTDAEEVRSAVLLKRVLETETFEPDYVGIRHTGSEWFVGYGMDTHGLFRNLPELYVIEQR